MGFGFSAESSAGSPDAPTRLDRHSVVVAYKVVIAGGGVAGLEAVLALRALAPELVSVELASPAPVFAYRPLAVAVPFGRGQVHEFDLRAFARECGADLRVAALRGVDAAERRAFFDTGDAATYDALLVACGTITEAAVPGADTFTGPADVERLRGLLDEIDAGRVSSVVFVAPHGATWPLPLYELALQTAVHAGGAVKVSLVTAEEEPLDVLGPASSRATTQLLAEHGIDLRCGVYPTGVTDGRLSLAPTGTVTADRFVAMPVLRGVEIHGVPHNAGSFIPVDEHARVQGLANVFAAGDITTYPVKQGGVAAQQADTAAEYIAAEAGAAILPTPFRPVLRSVLLTGDGPRYLSARIRDDGAVSSVATRQPFWSPPDKIAAPFLAPYLAKTASGSTE